MNEDIYAYILKFLPVKDVLTCSTLNKLFYTISKSEILWKFIIIKNCYSKFNRLNCYETYKLYYLVKKMADDGRLKYKRYYEW